MKLQHLAIGARFEYEGKTFVKTGPLTASSENGGQQIIPRYAVLKPVGTPENNAPQAKPAKSDHAAIRLAFENFYRTAERLTIPEAREELAQARAAFLARLD